MKFGDPKHPWIYTSEHARAAAKKARAVSPWGKAPMIRSARALATFERNRKAREIAEKEDT
jgi:hypothetical protein